MIIGLQKEIFDWCMKNFSENKTTEQLINEQIVGMIEELGELAHGILKQEQQIRLNENHLEEIEDAIGDILVFGMNLLSLLDIDSSKIVIESKSLDEFLKESKHPFNSLFILNCSLSDLIDYIINFYIHEKLHDICKDCDESEECIDSFNNNVSGIFIEILNELQYISIKYLESKNIIKIFVKTTNKVLKRDWNKHREKHL